MYPLIFGLDIGTRSIVGIVGYRKADRIYVVAQESMEHSTRAMLDGQIHDIGKVAETIAQVKQRLESTLGRELKDVCIAAAGRVLRTITTYAQQDFGLAKEVTQEDIYSLVTLGVEKAYEEFTAGNDSELRFYCVGHSAIRYYMNGYPIGNLDGHKAQVIGVDLIATFLPDDVVDGLYKAVEMAGLKVVNLTLEPIAAMQVAIPEKYRMLNMALVDVGAGTSDISITKSGAITAYGMIPVAGDSLTDIIVQHCLVDFDTAEFIKRQAATRKEVEYVDIMGLPQTILSTDVNALLADAITHMTKLVADCIKELNGDKPVSAVFVVGGGGIVPGYTESLAKELGISTERVAIRGEQVMQMITFEQENVRKDSLMVTPIGICLSYYEQGNYFIFVMFNDIRLKMFDNGDLSIADAALQAQFPNDALFPKRGQALTFTVNGKSRMVRGHQGETAIITLNGESADIHTKVHNGDHIRVVPSTAGAAAKSLLGKLPEMAEPLVVIVNGTKIRLPKTAKVGDTVRNEFYEIQDGDEITVLHQYTVQEIAQFMDMTLSEGMEILVNDTPAKPHTKVSENFTISWNASIREQESKWSEEAMSYPISYLSIEKKEEDQSVVTDDEANQKGKNDDVKNGETDPKSEYDTLRNAKADPKSDDHASSYDTPANGSRHVHVMINGQPFTLTGKSTYVFVDIFEVYPFDLQNSKGKNLEAQLNGESARYLQELNEGDVIRIFWKK
ncbi:MAG: rod shape-determining protein [Lachnospiraceae bacterium]|jgi:cell division protein FtsA|nr:rod shape-determining protein [Lachnospiraceae bacterium]